MQKSFINAAAGAGLIVMAGAASAQDLGETQAHPLKPLSSCEMLVVEGEGGELNRLLYTEGCSKGAIHNNVLRQETYGRTIKDVCPWGDPLDTDECKLAIFVAPGTEL